MAWKAWKKNQIIVLYLTEHNDQKAASSRIYFVSAGICCPQRSMKTDENQSWEFISIHSKESRWEKRKQEKNVVNTLVAFK